MPLLLTDWRTIWCVEEELYKETFWLVDYFSFFFFLMYVFLKWLGTESFGQRMGMQNAVIDWCYLPVFAADGLDETVYVHGYN